MQYTLQHNGKGKTHLLVDSKELCGSFGMFNFTNTFELAIENGKIYEVGVLYNDKTELTRYHAEIIYCKKCLKAAIKKATE